MNLLSRETVTIEECESALREEYERVAEGNYMTVKQKNQLKKSKTEDEDKVKQKKERKKSVRTYVARTGIRERKKSITEINVKNNQ